MNIYIAVFILEITYNYNYNFYIAPKLYIVCSSVVYIEIITPILTSNPFLRAARHFSALSLGYQAAPGKVNLSEQERLNDLVPQRGFNYRPSDLQSSKTLHSAILSLKSYIFIS